MSKAVTAKKTQPQRARDVASAKRCMEWVRDALEDAKTRDLVTLDMRKISDFTDYMIIATGTSNRHVQSSADKIVDALRVHGIRTVGVEGGKIGDWVLIDFGFVVAHVMREETRDFYNLEKLWSDAKRIEVGENRKTAKTPRSPRKSKATNK